ncbi:hypothetical protein GCM10028864_26110 [Microlunatus parietis]
MEVRLYGTYFSGDDLDEYEDPYVAWSAEWAWRDNSVGTEDGSNDIAELVSIVLSSIRKMARGRTVELDWEVNEIDGLRPGAVDKELAAAGVTLPTHV